MTNHPRRAGRRKDQRQMQHFFPALRAASLAATASADQMRKLHDAARRVVWGNGRIDEIEIHPPRQQQLKEPA